MEQLDTLIGSIRRFGPVGPPYEIIGPVETGRDGAKQMRIRVIESDEDLDYPLADILDDPKDI
jgi:hypothetical protein